MSQNEITRKIKTWQQPSKQTVRAGMEVIPMKSNRLTMDLGNLKLDESTLERVRNAAVKAAMQEAQKSIGTARPKSSTISPRLTNDSLYFCQLGTRR